MTNGEYYIGFSHSGCIGPRRLTALLARYGSLEKAFYAPVNELTEVLGLRAAVLFDQFRTNYHPAFTARQCRKAGIRVIHREHPDYPSSLRHLTDPPLVIYVQGSASLPGETDPATAVVGTRKPTGYGNAVAREFAGRLAAHGVPVVSGLAYGIDSTAHTAALDNNGCTIAVLGSGVDTPYPAGNSRLAHRIPENGGLLISEYPPGTPARKFHFVQRNRIIAALSRGVMVVEGASGSGALLTADFAGQLGREVYVPPMPLYSALSEGPNMLARNGATVVYEPGDILRDMGMVFRTAAKTGGKSQDPVSETLRKRLAGKPESLTELAAGSGLPVSRLAGTLTLMELNGEVIRDPDGTYRFA